MSGRNNYFGDGLHYRVRRDIISCNKGVIDFKKSELISLNKLLYALVLPTSIIYIYIYYYVINMHERPYPSKSSSPKARAPFPGEHI